MKIEPYFSLDIETTGLNTSKAQILEIAVIYDDGITPTQQLEKQSVFRECIWNNLDDINTYYEPFAMSMHSDLLTEIARRTDTCNISTATLKLQAFIELKTKENYITFAGKNIAGFDLPILKNNKFKLPRHKHRVIDVGSLYYSKFGYVPSLQEINDLIGYTPVSHRALSDAWNVIIAIRHLMGKTE